MRYSFICISLALCLVGCGMRSQSEDKASEEQPKTAVTVTNGVYGHIERTTTFPATAVYRNKSVVTAPVPGFILRQYVTVGTRVKAGQRLCCLESKERHAVGGTGEDGLIPINASCDGIVLDVPRQTGDYVAEGTTICVVAESASLVFEINVPYEQRAEVRGGGVCALELPDGTRLTATVQSSLAEMNTVSQSERVVAYAKAPFLPEGLRLKAIFSAGSNAGGKSMLLPASAVQSDETLTRHWVMRLGNDSTAVKVPVEVVGRNSLEVEILSDSLSLQDRIILTGGYGLEDGAKVVVTE